MAITYTWEVTKIKTLNAVNFENAVGQVHWNKLGTDENENTSHFAGVTSFDADMIDADNFTELSQLTEDMVIGWVQAKIAGSYEDRINMIIKNQINDMITPATELNCGGMPWQSADI